MSLGLGLGLNLSQACCGVRTGALCVGGDFIIQRLSIEEPYQGVLPTDIRWQHHTLRRIPRACFSAIVSAAHLGKAPLSIPAL